MTGPKNRTGKRKCSGTELAMIDDEIILGGPSKKGARVDMASGRIGVQSGFHAAGRRSRSNGQRPKESEPKANGTSKEAKATGRRTLTLPTSGSFKQYWSPESW